MLGILRTIAMKERMFHFILALAFVASSFAETRITGVVRSEGVPVADAIVMEINKDHRILHQTRTDSQGRYSILFTHPEKNSIRVLAAGYYPITHKLREFTQVTVNLTPREHSVNYDTLPGRHKGIQSNKLFVGRVGDGPRPQISRLEMVSDTLFSFIVPLRVDALVDDYRAGRNMMFLGDGDELLLNARNGMDVKPIEGDPEDISDKIRPINHNVQIVHGQTPNVYTNNYVYPRFLISRNELFSLIENASRVRRIAFDTVHADNYWLLYPSDDFESELHRIVYKLMK